MLPGSLLPSLRRKGRLWRGNPAQLVADIDTQTEALDRSQAARLFARGFNTELFTSLKQQAHTGNGVLALNGQAVLFGVSAREGSQALAQMIYGSRTFERFAEGFVQAGRTLSVLIGHGPGHSRSTMGLGHERIHINVTQGSLFDLLLHEAGHALGGFPDGLQGQIGPNQQFQAQVKRELGIDHLVRPYGYEVRPATTLVRSGFTPIYAARMTA